MVDTPYNKTELDAQYRCQVCGVWKVVPSLARDCERRHQEEDE